MDRMKRTTHVICLAAAALALAACSAQTESPAHATLEDPATVDAGTPTDPVDEKRDADGHSKTNPLEDPAFESLTCGDTYCGPDQRCCRSMGQCYPADCPDCCDGAREGYFGDGPEIFDMHRGPTDEPIRDNEPDDGWIKHDIEPDEPDPAE